MMGWQPEGKWYRLQRPVQAKLINYITTSHLHKLPLWESMFADGWWCFFSQKNHPNSALSRLVARPGTYWPWAARGPRLRLWSSESGKEVFVWGVACCLDSSYGCNCGVLGGPWFLPVPKRLFRKAFPVRNLRGAEGLDKGYLGWV